MWAAIQKLHSRIVYATIYADSSCNTSEIILYTDSAQAVSNDWMKTMIAVNTAWHGLPYKSIDQSIAQTPVR